MSQKKIDRALYGPSTTEVALGALLGLLAGVALAAVYLVFKPVQVSREVPKEPTVGMVYFTSGAEGGAKAAGWQAKQTDLVAGKPVVVNEEELNAWAGTVGSAPPPAAAPGKEAPVSSDAGFIIPTKANFHVIEDRVQIGMPVTLNYFGLTYATTAYATGNFKRSGNTVVFNAEKVYLGSCPLHFIPGAGGMLVSSLISKGKFSDELRTAWARVSEVSVGGGVVNIAVQ